MDILIREKFRKAYEVKIERDATQGSGIVFIRELDSEHPTRLAQFIGRKVLELAGEEDIEDYIKGHEPQGGPSWIRIWLRRKEPEQVVGFDWLRKQTWGTQLHNSEDGHGGHFTVMCNGLHWHHSGNVWKWDGTALHGGDDWRNVPWVKDACPLTCPKLTP